ncbi:hypothetical protein E2C01_011250 [Portunus trituberculatus]|uniref:Uncharacterized protein n=1 Tax=Portunus trituberculatus TaxID=210409 RepID=A0A5B7DAL2_PORTR|nr:hypothetical protein [Portunus trituberculatus]
MSPANFSSNVSQEKKRIPVILHLSASSHPEALVRDTGRGYCSGPGGEHGCFFLHPRLISFLTL